MWTECRPTEYIQKIWKSVECGRGSGWSLAVPYAADESRSPASGWFESLAHHTDVPASHRTLT